MRRSIIATLAVAGLGLSGCATLSDPAGPVAPLALAFSEPVPALEQRAGRGETGAEYALAFLSRFGLRGVPQDETRSDRLRTAASTPTTLMITQYIPAIGGGAGQTRLIPITQPGLSRGQMALLDLCGLAAIGGDALLGIQACGGPEGWARIAPLARSLAPAPGRHAAPDSAASTPLP